MINLYNGDSYNILKSMDSKSVDLIITDPPYEVSDTKGGGSVNRISKLQDSLQALVDLNITEGYDIEKYGEEFMRIMKTPNIYLWCNKKQIPAYFNFYVNKHGCSFEIICWHKTNALPTYSNKYLSDTEYCLYFHKGKGKTFPNNYEDAKTFYIAPINQSDKKQFKHPTIKPLDVIEKLVRNSSVEGDVVMDTFMGSGTTGVACKNLNRNFIGMEINEEYFNIARDRIGEVSDTSIIASEATGLGQSKNSHKKDLW